MANSETVVDGFHQMLLDQDRTYAWLSRRTGIPYKRILAEVKSGTRPLSLDTAISVAGALGAELPAVVEGGAAR